MKQFVTLLMIILFAHTSQAQDNNYSSLWKKVEQHEIEGLPQSALKVVESIAERAKKDKNNAQFVKTMLFKSKFALILEEDAQLKIINDFKTEIVNSEFPTTNILESLLANLYWQYFQENRYKFYNRTKTEEKVDIVDFRTWDLQTLFNEINLHFINSLKSGLMLQQEDLKTYNVLLQTVPESKIFRPTLFDFLTQTALEFYKTDETSIPNPAYKFEINQSEYLGNTEIFSKINIASKDTTSLQLHALKLYQDLVQFHLKDTDPTALVDVDLDRLNYIKQNAVLDNKEALFLETLKYNQNKYKDHEVSGLYAYEIANLLFMQSKAYKPDSNEDSRWKAKDALEICDAIILKFPKSKGALKCEGLKQIILAETLTIKTESYLPIQQFSKVLVNYKNIPNLKFKVFAISEKELKSLNTSYSTQEQLAVIQKLKLITEWNHTLRNEGDYQQHSTEVKIPKLNNGRFLLYAEHKNEDTTFAFSVVQVTDFALVQKSEELNTIYQIINRNNGQPISNASVKISYQVDYRSRYHTFTETTNTNGEISIGKKTKRWTNIKVEVTKNNQKAYFGNYYINRYYNNGTNKNQINYNGFLFTDRSIYRPGQTVYFKGIAIKTEDTKSQVLTNEIFTIYLYNVNFEEISKLELKTNEFGSVSGEFVLPNSGLTGNYRINMKSIVKGFNPIPSATFSVEEYKRPKFEAKFNPVTETFKIDDSVTVKGNAQAYAGSSISDSKVVYRVVRKVDYPRWFYWYRPSFNSAPQEIAHGESQTDASGNFDITFKALADKSSSKENLPIFRYSVTADITDLNGETRSATTTINVGYHTLTANLNVAHKLDKTKKDNSISIDTKNLNGEFVPAKGNIKIYKLQAPEFVLRTRPWAAPDFPEYSLTEFKKLFPNEAYKNEDNSANWKKGKLVLDENFDTEKSKSIALKNIKKWESGQYIIELESKDKFGQLVKDVTKTTLYSNKDQTLADHQLFSITKDKSEYKPGENVNLTIGSSSKDITVFVAIEKAQKIIKTYKVELNNSFKKIEIPVTDKDLGGFAVHYSYAVYNTFQNGVISITVPFPKTDLEIETSTFRDKLQPGVEETWNFKIKGPKGEKVSAELLASMYDMSLDQFKPHQLNFNPIHLPTYYSQIRINGNQSFVKNNFRVHNSYSVHYNNLNQNYDRFNWFGLNLGNARWIRAQYLRNLNTVASSVTSSYSSSIKEGIIEGTVYDDDGMPLVGATIVVKGSTNGVSSDFDGKFSIKAKKDEILTVSYVGFNSIEYTVAKNNLLSIILSSDSAQLEEVVVVGYGTNKKSRSVSASIETLEMEEDVVAFAIQGQASGVQIEGTSNQADAFVKIRGNNSIDGSSSPLYVVDGKVVVDVSNINPNDIESINVLKGSEATSLYGSKGANGVVIITTKNGANSFKQVKVRTNLKETAFFFPQLQTDKEGNVSFSFTTPEALTKWKLQLVAHTKNLESATKTLQTVTQKELMVMPNAPRFLREGDQITFSSKIANLSDKALSGSAILLLYDALTNKTVDINLGNAANNKTFSVDAKGNTNVSWDLSIPEGIQAVQYKIIAKTEDYSDGEQNVLPVLSNRMLVTETLPMWLRSNQTKTFTLDKLKNVSSTTLRHHNLSLEITSNPAWYAVQALPYLMEYPYECNEQTFSRFYANTLASHIANSNPRIQDVFNQWKNTDALLSNLEKNQELKSLLIQETPWLRDAQSETEQKKRIALLFDLNKMNSELQSSLKKLKQNQLGNGSWPWFDGGRPNRFITQHIITGFGHLKKLNVLSGEDEKAMIKKAVKYLDAEFIQEYQDLKKYNKDVDLSKDHLSHTQLHYLYMRSFYPEINTSKKVEEIRAYYHKQIKNYWLSRSLYSKGLMALVLHRLEDSKSANKILKSLKENSITSEELGMYWKANTSSWYWYQAPIETQALLIEAFSEIENDTATIDNLKIWLLKNKQTNRWKTTKATTEAVYALLLQGSDWLSVTDMVDVEIGGQKIEPSKLENVKVEAGTGYFNTSWKTTEIKPEMAEVTLTKKGKGIAWGSLYWQYFEDLDKITSAETPLKLKKKLFLKTNTDLGEELSEIDDKSSLKIGDLVRVRIELRTDRNMEFVHMKDMRAAGFEPVNVISRYKYQDGLGYYESTKDAATNFFMDYLPKGIYVFEYDLRVNNAGDMSNGITTIQSMYAPEFSSHSEGIRVNVN